MATSSSELTGIDLLYEKKIFRTKTAVYFAYERVTYYAAGSLFARGTAILIMVP